MIPLKPASPFVSFVLTTKFFRFFGKRLIHSYLIKAPDGTSFWVRPTDESDQYIIKEIYGEAVYDELAVSNGDVVIDVGANIGVFSTRASERVGAAGKVISVEPIKDNIRLLKKNLKQNGCTNVQILKLALSNSTKDGVMNVYQRHGSSSFVSKSREKLLSTQLVKVDTLDNVVSMLGLSRVDELKIDVEGAELDVLQGAVRTLSKHRPKVAIEIHPWGPSRSQITEFLQEQGYRTELREGEAGLALVFGM